MKSAISFETVLLCAERRLQGGTVRNFSNFLCLAEKPATPGVNVRARFPDDPFSRLFLMLCGGFARRFSRADRAFAVFFCGARLTAVWMEG